MKVIIYTDGSSLHNGAPHAIGGWGCLLQLWNHGELILEKEKSGHMPAGVPAVTNNRAEITAVLEGLKSITSKCKITIISDSQLVVKTLNHVFRVGSNSDLWALVFREIERLNYIKCAINVQWVKGHNKHPENERVDKLAGDAMRGTEVDRVSKE